MPSKTRGRYNSMDTKLMKQTKTKHKMHRNKRDISTSDWEYFDNCSICHAMKEGRASTEEELKKVFEEAKKNKEGIGF